MDLDEIAIWKCDKDEPEKAAAVAIAVASRYGAHHDNLAAIFDIDETLLKNSEYYLKNKKEDMYAVQPCGKILFNHCRKKGIQIFLVTARRKSAQAKEYVSRQLRDLGYDLEGVRLYMTSKEYDHLNDAGAKFKAAARKRITKNYVVVMNCGDRWSDVSTKHAKQLEKALPSDMYIGIKPDDANILHGIKFPEFD